MAFTECILRALNYQGIYSKCRTLPDIICNPNLARANAFKVLRNVHYEYDQYASFGTYSPSSFKAVLTYAEQLIHHNVQGHAFSDEW